MAPAGRVGVEVPPDQVIPRGGRVTSRMRTVVIAVVTAVWAANFAAGLIPALEYQPDQAINGIFMTIVGGMVALGAREKKGEGK